MRTIGLLLTVAAAMAVQASPVVEGCKEKWPTNYVMQEHCINEAERAAEQILRRHAERMKVREYPNILRDCSAKWTDNPVMLEYCISEQLGASARLRGR